MNMNEYMIKFDAFEGLQRTITLFRIDIFLKFLLLYNKK